MIFTLTDISQYLTGKVSPTFISPHSWRAGELVESWKVNVNVIVVEAPHGWVRGPPVVETGYIPLSSIQVVYEDWQDCTNPHRGRTLPCHHSSASHLTSPQSSINNSYVAVVD